MHIAICDDNVADRKQLERLLARESDRRKCDTGVFYVNSFGNTAVLGKSPMQYNLFFIDIVSEEQNGLDFALSIIQAGVTAPIVLCSSSIDYLTLTSKLEHPPTNLFHIQKPIRYAELTSTLDIAILQQSHIIPTIELRSGKETYHVFEDDIICGIANDRLLNIMLADGRTIQILDSLDNFYTQIIQFSHFSLVSPKAFVNITFISDISLLNVTLNNHMSLKVTPKNRAYLKKITKLMTN